MKALLLSVVLYFLANTAAAQTAEELFDRGYAKYLNGYLDSAVTDFTEAIELDGEYWQVYHYRGHANYYRDSLELAYTDYLNTVQLNPEHFQSYFAAGKISYRKGNYPDAVLNYKKAVANYKGYKSDPDTIIPLVYQSYARLFMVVAEEDSALLRTPKLLSMLFTPVDMYDANLNSPVNITSLPDSSVRRLLFDSAEVYLIMAMQVEPEEPAHRLMLGNLLYQRGYDLEGAIENYHKAIEYSPAKYYDAHFNLGIIYNEMSMFDLARDNLLIAADLRQDSAQPRFLLAQIYAKLNKPALVELWLSKGSFIKPPEASDYYQVGTGFGKTGGNLDMAIVYLKKAIELNPAIELYYEDLGVAYGLSGRFDDAITINQRLIEVNPTYAAAYLNLSISYRNKGNKKLAAKYLKKHEEMLGQK